MGMAGMYLVLYPLHKIYMAGWWRWGLIGGFKLHYRFFAVRSFWVVLGYIALDVLMVILDARDGVAHWAHIAGLAGGIVLAMVLLVGRMIYSGSDLLSLALGRHAWPLMGTPHSRLARNVPMAPAVIK
jgi:membrane associated rhomboid family serine protease